MTEKSYKKIKDFTSDLWVGYLRPSIIVIATVLIMFFAVSKVVSYVQEHYLLPPQPDNDETFILEIPAGYGVHSIAKLLEENEIISNSFVFRVFVDISNNSYKLQSGKYYFRHNMTMQEVMNQLLIGNNSVPTTNITIPEGWTITRIANYLTTTKGFTNFTAQEFIDYCVPENFSEYWFINEIPEERYSYGYVLQGYLFPDTYTVYVDATPRDIIIKMLDNFEKKLSKSIVQEAEEKGYTLDELITFASILEKEAANTKEYARCAACFRNRLDNNMALQSCSTVIYALALQDVIRTNSFEISTEDTNTVSGYNTYINKGLPIGPISNPGMAAIKAVLNPNEDDIKNGTMFFTLNPDTGTHTFSSDYATHAYYSELYAKRYKELQAETGD